MYLSLKDVKVLGSKQVHHQINSIIEKSGLICEQLDIKRETFSQHTTMIAYMFPKVTQLERIININIINDILFYIDDMYNDDRMLTKDTNLRTLFLELIDILEGKSIENNHKLHNAAHTVHKMIKNTPLSWQNRFLVALKDFFYATTDSIESLKTDDSISIEKYIVHREHVSGMYTTIVEIEYAYNSYLPNFVTENPQIQRLGQICAQYCALLNDIFSYHKEVIVTGTSYNFVSVIQSSHKCSFEEAVHIAVLYLNSLVEEFQTLETELTIASDNEILALVDKFIDGLKDQMIAGWYWQWSTNRYRSSESPFIELRTLL